MTATIFTENLDISEAIADKDTRSLNGVILIRAGVSLNKRSYSEALLQKSAPIFEGTRAFDSHIRGERRVGELTGYYTNVRYQEGKLLADRHFTNTQAGRDVWAVVEDIVSGKAPKSLAGLSINAVGQGKTRKTDDGDVLEVESITSAMSVDDVLSAAAGGTYLTASAGGDELAAALLKNMSFEEFFEARPDFIQRIQNEMKTIRQDQALKAAETAKQTALAEAERLTAALQTAQAELSERITACEAAESQRDKARRELAIEQALHAVNLPASWKQDLRQQLLEADPDKWAAIIESEGRKAASAGVKARVEVSGAGQQVQTQTLIEHKVNLSPEGNESADDWLKRLARS